jgi:HSP20 family protein
MTKRKRPTNLAFIDMRDEFLKPFDQVFDQMLSQQFPNFYEQTGIDFLKGAYPKCNIIDNTGDVQVIAEIPGLTKDDVNIKVENGVMTISGKQSTVAKDSEVKYIRRELKHSSFKRSFELSDTLNPSKISAKFENGILNITIPKKEESLPKAIDITID